MQKIVPNNRSKLMNNDDFIVSKTDLKGNITYCNEVFIKYSGYSENELLGKPHNIIRHPDMPKVIFHLLWERIKNKQEIFAYVNNLSADGSNYWVYANVTASVDSKDNVIGYYSVRRKPTDSALKQIDTLYKTLLEKEKKGGLDVSKKYLNDLLENKEVSYDEFVNYLQNGDA